MRHRGKASDHRKPVIVGWDYISPLGTDQTRQWQRFFSGESGVGPLTRWPLRERFPVHIAGQVPPFDESPFPFLAPRLMAHWSSPVFKHGMLVAYRALADAGIEVTPELAPRTAITFSTAIGGLDAILAAERGLAVGGKMPHPFANPNSCVNMVGGKISILTGATGPIVTPVAACASGSSSLMFGAMLLASGDADVAICGAVDFPVIEPVVGGFGTMNGAYKFKAGIDEPPQTASRPFSVNRRGFVVAEGAACIILTSKEFAEAHGLHARMELAGWSSTADAHHFVAPNSTTVERCMRQAIARAGIAPEDIDAVNAHAASTKVGDQIEAERLAAVFASGIPPVTANKSQIGHCMGASSAVESVLAMESMLHSTQLPTLNHCRDPELPELPIVSQASTLEQEFVLKNAFGFGGCNICLVFHRMD